MWNEIVRSVFVKSIKTFNYIRVTATYLSESEETIVSWFLFFNHSKTTTATKSEAPIINLKVSSIIFPFF